MENLPTIMFAQGETVFKEGETSNSLYLIISGQVEISRQLGHKKLVLATKGKDSLFGEMALIDGKVRSATATALERSFCYKCSALGVLEEMKKIDRDISKAMKSFAAIIRKNNDIKLKTPNQVQNLVSKDIIFDKNIKEPYITKEEAMNNKELNDKVELLSPFIKSMYRILIKNAYDIDPVRK